MASFASRTLRDGEGLVPRRAQVDESQDTNIGSAVNDSSKSNSASSLVSTLVPVLIVATVWFIAFHILRRRFPRRYAPRTFLSTLREKQRSPALSNKLFGWYSTFTSLPDSYVLTHHSLDGYLFLRFLKICVVMCLVGCAITWPVLFPVNITGGGGKTQFDVLTMGNVQNSYYRYFAHAGCAYLFFGFVIFMITRESIYYINLRQAFLMSPLYAQRISSKTVLFTSVPDDYLNEATLRKALGDSVVRVWLPTDTKDLEEMVEERDKTILRLEAAETKLCKAANAAMVKSQRGGEAAAADSSAVDAEPGSVAARWIKRKDRPTHRLKPLIGQKVDTIEWCRAELPGMIGRVEAEQAKHRAVTDVKQTNAVFVQFTSLQEAQAAFQSLTHHQVLHMAPRFTGLSPAEVIWKNLRIRWYERIIRGIATTSFVVALIIFWSIPVAIVGSISNIDKLTTTNGLTWLSFINKLPGPILGVVTGLLPVILLAVLMALLPIILRFMARLGGVPTLSAIELRVQHSYFAFQVVQVFLVATLGSAASSSAGAIAKDPTSITRMLSERIPLASNFYLAYFVLQGLGVVAGLLVGLVGLVISLVLSKLLDNTPRKMYKRWTQMASLGWGTVLPIYTNLMVIGICYACIAPLVLGFAGIGLYLFYLAYRYNFLFVYNVAIDTKGLIYPRALQHLFVGLYIAQACLIGLFAINAGRSPGAIGSLILMIIFLIFTALYHINLNGALTPLLNYMPKSLVAEEDRILELERGASAAGGTPKGHGAGEGRVVELERTGNGPPSNGVHNGDGLASKEQGESSGYATTLPPPHQKPGMIKKFLRPDIYTDYATMRRLVPRDLAVIHYEPAVAADAYLHPAVSSPPGMIWIPRDGAGVSAQEVRDTSRVIAITDEGAYLDEKNKIVWDSDKIAPIHEEPVVY